MSQLNKLIDLIIKDRMMVRNCTDDGRKCIKCQYEALKEPKPKPSYERVPEGVFVIGKHSNNLYYQFGNKQLLTWENGCYCVYRHHYTEAYSPASPYLIPTTFGELKPGEWYQWRSLYGLKTSKDASVSASNEGEIELYYPSDHCKILRVSEVMP